MKRIFNFLIIALAIIAGLFAVGIILSDDASADDDLTVNAWVPAKYTHNGDTIEIYAETSYEDGVSVDAEVYYYDVTLLDAINHFQIPDAEKKLVETISMDYMQGDLYDEDYWIAEFTIPEDAEGGVYGVRVIARDGGIRAEDDSHSRLESLVDDHIIPLQDAIIEFRDGQLQTTIDNVVDDLKEFNGTLTDHGGIPGITDEATEIQEWDNLIIKGKSDMDTEDAAYFLESLAAFLMSDEYLVIEDMGYSLRNFFFDMEKNNLNDELTTSMFDSLMYIIGFDEDEMIMSYIGELDNTDDIISAYNTLQATQEYEDFRDSLEDISNWDHPFISMQEAMNAMVDIAISDEFEALLEEFQNYLEDADGYDPTDSELQDLIYWSAENGDDEMEMLMDTQEYQDWLDALETIGVKEVIDALNDTINAIADEMEMLGESDGVADLEEELDAFGLFMDGIEEYTYIYFEHDWAISYTFDVPDAEWMTGFTMDIWGRFYSDYGNVTIDIFSPEGLEDSMTYDAEEDRWFGDWYEWELIPGEWKVVVDGDEQADGSVDIDLWSHGDFGEYYLLETFEELFLVQNAGIAVQAPFVVEEGNDVVVRFAAYGGEGPLANQDLNVMVMRVDPYADPGDSDYPEDAWPLSYDGPVRILNQEIITTNGNGIATLEVDVNMPGVYSYIVELVYASEKDYYAAMAGGFLGVEYTIDLGLDQIGNIMGIPVYMNPEGIGDELDLDITLSERRDADVEITISPLDLSDLFEDIDMDYDEDSVDLEFNNQKEKSTSLDVNGPVSLIGAYGDSDTASLAFGILLTTDIGMSVTTDDDMAPGGRHALDIESASGTPQSTYGVVLLESWLDVNSFDTAYITSLAFGSMFGEIAEPEPGDVAEDMRTLIYGEGNTAFADIPALLWDDDFMLLTITEVRDGAQSRFGVSLSDGTATVSVDKEMTIEVITADPETNTTIEVKVTSDGNDLEGVEITVEMGDDLITTTTTDASGIAEFQVTEAGTYYLTATMDGYKDDEETVVVQEEGSEEERLLIIPITEDPIDGKEFTIKVINNVTGTPLQGVEVKIMKGQDVVKSGFTDILGEISFVLDKGTYTVKAEKDGYTYDERQIEVKEDDGGSDGIPGFELMVLIMGLALAVFIRKK